MFLNTNALRMIPARRTYSRHETRTNNFHEELSAGDLRKRSEFAYTKGISVAYHLGAMLQGEEHAG